MGPSQINAITKSSTKLYYEALLFSQEGGLQQIYCYTKKEIRTQYQSAFE
jgi:hypothetical protein